MSVDNNKQLRTSVARTTRGTSKKEVILVNTELTEE